MKRIAVLTSGGDSPGMNPFIRAVVRRALSYGMEVFGVQRGYQGLIDGTLQEMNVRSVGGIINRAGTILETARSEEFRTPEGQREALRRINEREIEGLVVLGGDGSLRGAMKLHEKGIRVVGAPGTIDNDMYGTTMTIGVDTALNVALNAIDMIRSTASSHRRAFLIEVMGRDSGYLALMAGMSAGAEMVCIPERPFEIDEIIQTLERSYIRGKSHCLIIVAEGAQYKAQDIEAYLHEHAPDTGFEVRSTVLGHIQRGGIPTAYERILATRLGCAAVDCLWGGHTGVMVGLQGSDINATPIPDVVSHKKTLNLALFDLVHDLEYLQKPQSSTVAPPETAVSQS